MIKKFNEYIKDKDSDLNESLTISTEEILKIANELNFVTPTDDQVQYVKDNIEEQSEQDPTGWWGVWVEDLLYDQEIPKKNK